MKCTQITIITAVTANLNFKAPLLRQSLKKEYTSLGLSQFNWETFLSIIPVFHWIAQEEDPQDFLTYGSIESLNLDHLIRVATGLDFKLIHYKNNFEASMAQIYYTTSLDVVTCFLYCSCNSLVLRTL